MSNQSHLALFRTTHLRFCSNFTCLFTSKLTINANKTKSMLIGSNQKVHNTDLNVSIAGVSVAKVNDVKCLGVIIDESLSWGPHVEYVKKTVSSKLGTC